MGNFEWRSGEFGFNQAASSRGDTSHMFISNDLWEGSDEEKYKKAIKENEFYKVARFKCVSCGETSDLSCCTNCSRGLYQAGFSTDGSKGLFCNNCESGFTSWTCSSCGAKNPVGRSIQVLDSTGACFIATAVYGSYEAPEVLILRTYRDEILLNSTIGILFVKLYYLLSPSFSKYLKNTKILKVIIREKILTPFVEYIERKLIK